MAEMAAKSVHHLLLLSYNDSIGRYCYSKNIKSAGSQRSIPATPTNKLSNNGFDSHTRNLWHKS